MIDFKKIKKRNQTSDNFWFGIISKIQIFKANHINFKIIGSKKLI